MDTPSKPGKPRRMLLAALVVLGVAAGGAWTYYHYMGGSDAAVAKQAQKGSGKGGTGSKGGKSDANRPVPVVAEAARVGDIGIYLNGLGSVVPLRTVTVRSRVEGELMRVLFTEGQSVKAGSLLAEIDPRPFQVQLSQAEGQLMKDQALLSNARIDLERARTLFTKGFLAKQQADTQAGLVRQYEGVVRADQAQVDNARLQLTYARITAPIDGRLGLRQVDPGNIVRATDPNGVVVITQTQPITSIFTIPQDNLPQVMRRMQQGDSLPVEAWDREYRTKLAAGALLTVDNLIDPATGTVRLKAQFGNGDSALFPNQFVNVRMLVDTLRGVVTVPAAALQRGSQGPYVYVVKEDNTASVRPVKPGPAEAERVAIPAGLAAGERVVVDGVDRLREGARVQLTTRNGNGERKQGAG